MSARSWLRREWPALEAQCVIDHDTGKHGGAQPVITEKRPETARRIAGAYEPEVPQRQQRSDDQAGIVDRSQMALEPDPCHAGDINRVADHHHGYVPSAESDR